MYRNILIPVALDDDDKTRLALDAARALAVPDARLTLLHVIEELPGYMRNYLPKTVLAQARAGLQPGLDALAAELPGASGVIVEGRAASAILAYVAKHQIDCVVMAGQQPAMEDYLLGSTATHVVRHADCAVMVVR